MNNQTFKSMNGPSENHQYFNQLILNNPNAELGNLFGKPCGKTNKKAFVAFFQGNMVFKVGKEQVALLLMKYENSKNWDPSGKGRPMKDWIQIPPEYKEDWKLLIQQALEFSS